MKPFGAIRGPKVVVFAEGARHSVGNHAAAIGPRAFVVTDARFAQTIEFMEILASLHDAGVQTEQFTDTAPEIPSDQVDEVAQAAKVFEPDVLIGVGGGSCIDLAKVTSVVVAHGGQVSDYWGENRVPGATLPVIAMPTTAGTGSEVTPVAVVTDTARGVKAGVSSPEIIPHIAIIDPELSYTCPAKLTASVGADALAHLVESFTAASRPYTATLLTERVFVGKSELTDLYAREGIRLLAAHLEAACSNGNNTEARRAMSLAATFGGYALGTAGTAAAHAMQYPIGARTHTPHGVGVGILLPYVMEFNRCAAREPLAEIGELFGATTGGSVDERIDHGIASVRGLLGRIGIPATLREIGMNEADLNEAAEAAMGSKRLVENNPRNLDAQAILTIFKAALDGDCTEFRESAKPELVGETIS